MACAFGQAFCHYKKRQCKEGYSVNLNNQYVIPENGTKNIFMNLKLLAVKFEFE